MWIFGSPRSARAPQLAEVELSVGKSDCAAVPSHAKADAQTLIAGAALGAGDARSLSNELFERGSVAHATGMPQMLASAVKRPADNEVPNVGGKRLRMPGADEKSLLFEEVRQGSTPCIHELTTEFKAKLEDVSGSRCTLNYVKSDSNDCKDIWRGGCAAGEHCPVTYAVDLYLRCHNSIEPHTVRCVQHFHHDHDAGGDDSFRKIFTPAMKKCAENYILEHRPQIVDVNRLRRHLEHKKFAVSKLRNKCLSNWIGRFVRSLNRGKPATGPSTQSLLCSVAEWRRLGSEETATELVIVSQSTVDGTTGFIPFSCRLFLEAARKWGDDTICLGTDVKMKVVRLGWGVVSVGILFKDDLRNTTVGRLADGTKVQMRGRTTRYLPMLFALIDEDHFLFASCCEMFLRRTFCVLSFS